MQPGSVRKRDFGPKSVIIPRLYSLLWVLELEGEVASDLSAFHRIDNMWDMGSRRWALLVPMLYAYSGAVQTRLRVLAREQQDVDSSVVLTESGQGGGVARAADGTPLLPGPPSPLQGGQQVESTQTALAMSEIGDMFSFGTVAAPTGS